MDRASDSGSEGWGFESLPAYQKYGVGRSLPHIFVVPWDSKNQMRRGRASPARAGPYRIFILLYKNGRIYDTNGLNSQFLT